MEDQPKSCCPIGAEPKLYTDYKPRGTEGNIDDIPTYTIGQGDKAILLIPEIFGPNGGRTKLMCDQFADAGFYVLCVDLYKGDCWKRDDFEGVMDWAVKYTWDAVKDDLLNKVFPYLESKGFKTFGMLGCCWGSYALFNASVDERVKAGVSYHPSLTVYKETPDQLAEGSKCPHLVLPAVNDPESVREGSNFEKILKAKPYGDKVIVKTFTDMNHGWVPRGDLNDPKVARDVKLAMEMGVEFFKENL